MGRQLNEVLGVIKCGCTKCRNFFDYATGKPLKKNGFLHNPVYLDWVAHGGQEVEEFREELRGGCNNISIYDIRREFSNSEWLQFWVDFFQIRLHILGNVMHDVRRNVEEDIVGAQRDLAIKYTLNRITERKWISILKQRTKKFEYNREHLQICNLFDIISNQIIRNSFTDIEDTNHIKQAIELVENYNNQLQTLNKDFKYRGHRDAIVRDLLRYSQSIS